MMILIPSFSRRCYLNQDLGVAHSHSHSQSQPVKTVGAGWQQKYGELSDDQTVWSTQHQVQGRVKAKKHFMEIPKK